MEILSDLSYLIFFFSRDPEDYTLSKTATLRYLFILHELPLYFRNLKKAPFKSSA